MNHFGTDPYDDNEYVNNLYDAFTVNNGILKTLGYSLITPVDESTITKKYIYENAYSIYHYHGSYADIVDTTQKVNGITNLYIGDISVLTKAWGGSTSFPKL